MLEFNNEHMKANFSKLKNMVLEFNNEHAKASFKKIIDKITLEYNNNHAKANMKDLDLKLREALNKKYIITYKEDITKHFLNPNYSKNIEALSGLHNAALDDDLYDSLYISFASLDVILPCFLAVSM